MNRLLSSLLLAACASAVHAQPAPADIVEKASFVQWGAKSVQGEFELSIVRPSWQRSMKLAGAVQREGNKSFFRISAPAKEAGTASLSLGPEMWNYVPALERTIKIPPALALQPWLGSDITNDDVLQQGSRLQHYTHTLLPDVTVDGQAAYQVELAPKPDAPVAWDRVVHVIRKADFVPVSESYYDQRGALVRQMLFSEVKNFGGHAVPTRWEAKPADKPGHSTVITLHAAQYDKPVGEDLFTLRQLTNKR